MASISRSHGGSLKGHQEVCKGKRRYLAAEGHGRVGREGGHGGETKRPKNAHGA
ncbi:hypothetical protein DPMN_053275 [Dreissena polymorpha]|uniref:Uncharacterized protein n=1 Tax=Dreissena polymorpha TaxID=45954 RepID=A0A9D4CMQ8_DREPO|nr:hypothetical protein DPMN_053275 [Dreissena polymorpha]